MNIANFLITAFFIELLRLLLLDLQKQSFALHNRCSEKFHNIVRKIPVLDLFFNKIYLKETPTQVFSCEYREIFRNSFFYRTPPVAASGSISCMR